MLYSTRKTNVPGVEAHGSKANQRRSGISSNVTGGRSTEASYSPAAGLLSRVRQKPWSQCCCDRCRSDGDMQMRRGAMAHWE